MIFDTWIAFIHTLVVGPITYISLIILLRISGKRTLSKWNAFDFIVTIAFGSILGSILLLREVSLSKGLLGLILLVVLQYCISFLLTHFQGVREWIKGTPVLLVHQGKIRYQTLEQERITEDEVRAAVRGNGYAALEDVEAVVLETSGSFSVIDKIRDPSASALVDVMGYGEGD